MNGTKQIFITGIPTSGKSYLAKKLAAEVDGSAILLDDFRESLSRDERYRKAGMITIKDGKLLGESFGEDIRRFYENALIDRGYRLRIDLLVLYDPNQMVKAEKVDQTKSSVDPHLEEYLWRFMDSEHKEKALVGMVKILR